MKEINIDDMAGFQPRQLTALELLDSGRIKFLLYGGALGGGKSYFLRWYAVRRLILLFHLWGIRGAQGMLACENYPALQDRQLSKIGIEFPPWLGRMFDSHRMYGRCFILKPKWGGGVICFRNLDDPSKYASSEFAFILPDGEKCLGCGKMATVTLSIRTMAGCVRNAPSRSTSKPLFGEVPVRRMNAY
ncbi:MAG: hypothetical protein L6301_00870 [Desulfobacteraceae bacterium]|nr:hypothetical protein [Desulfobacteraceae bacterium]